MMAYVHSCRPCGLRRVPDLEVDVDVDDVGAGNAGLRAGVDAAYRAKYGRYGSASVDRMVTAEAAAATLRLTPLPGGPAAGTRSM
jgi:hypothetical protein